MAKTFNAYELTGVTVDSLASKPVATISDLDRAFATQGNVLYYYQFDSSATNATAEPTYIRPNDYVSAGVWVLQTISDANAFPVGSYIEHAGESAPAGFLVCDGSYLSRTTYSLLFAEIGVMYGPGDGSTTFQIPDFRGYFSRALDDGAGIDPDADDRTDRGDLTTGDVVGSKQLDELREHTHSTTADGVETAVNGGTNASDYGDGVTGKTGGDETRPKNINVLRCIKY